MGQSCLACMYTRGFTGADLNFYHQSNSILLTDNGRALGPQGVRAACRMRTPNLSALLELRRSEHCETSAPTIWRGFVRVNTQRFRAISLSDGVVRAPSYRTASSPSRAATTAAGRLDASAPLRQQ